MNEATARAATATTVHPEITFDRIEETVEDHEYPGLCIACGADASGIEPDAEAYACEECGSHTVYGCDQLVVLGLYH